MEEKKKGNEGARTVYVWLLEERAHLNELRLRVSGATLVA